MKFNSIKFKVGNLFTIILGIILILYSVFLQISLLKYLINDLDEDIAAKVDEIGFIISDELTAAPSDDVYTVIQRIFSFQDLRGRSIPRAHSTVLLARDAEMAC